MNIIPSIRSQVLGLWHGLPLPALTTDTTLLFQSWYQFNPSSSQWAGLTTANNRADLEEEVNLHSDSNLVLVTWNVDSTTPAPKTRISAIITHIQSLSPAVDIIFLQEVSRPALLALLTIPWIRDNWYSSEVETTQWGKQSFANVTLLSRSRFGKPDQASKKPTIGPVWRVKYASRFERDALCCDVILPTSSRPLGREREDQRRIRLVNVHLDSLPIQPSLRPRQLSTVASFLHATGCGLIAGDFNPVLPEDDGLVGNNGLSDVWSELRPGEPGFTWGVDGEQPFPPNRLDKIAVTGLKARDIRVLPCGSCSSGGDVDRVTCEQDTTLPPTNPESDSKHGRDDSLQWSDHSGLVFSMTL